MFVEETSFQLNTNSHVRLNSDYAVAVFNRVILFVCCHFTVHLTSSVTVKTKIRRLSDHICLRLYVIFFLLI